MTALAQILAERIAANGPISLADYMAECLLHPVHGYYVKRDPLGRPGDFTTAPEISQMFGELVGLCLAQCWLDQGAPKRFALAELGPGRGTLMADMLRAMGRVPGCVEAAEIHLVEASPVLQARQRDMLVGRVVTWHQRTETLPAGPLYLVANEFFDALPIRQFQRSGRGWRERQVGLAGGRLCFGLGPAADIGTLNPRLADTREGDVVETSPALAGIAAHIATRIARHGGAALIIDYGGWHSLGDTFQALKGHAPTDPLGAPGDSDLTAHVDFEAISHAFRAAGAVASGMTPQGRFLDRLGIGQRAARLAQNLSGEPLASHLAAHRRLTHPAEMGDLFKVIACHPRGTAPPPGLDPA